MKHIMVTGVSSGLGRHLADFFLQNGWCVFGTVRNTDDASDLEQRYPGMFIKLTADVTDQRQVESAVAAVEQRLDGHTLDLLVNNAGIATFGPLMYVPVDTFQHQLNVNVVGVIRVTQACLPLLGARKGFTGTPGQIVNIGSVSGLFATPFLGPYCASKHALEAISDCLRRELDVFGVKVIHLQPASVRSSIWEKSAGMPTYTEGTVYARIGELQKKLIKRAEGRSMDPMAVTKVVWRIAERKARRARYLITRNNLRYRLFTMLPDRIADALFRRGLRRLGLRRQEEAT